MGVPAEWEPQYGLLLTWPHNLSDWAPILPQIQTTYFNIISQALAYQDVYLIVPPWDPLPTKLRELTNLSCKLHFLAINTNDTWVRDYGPITSHNALRSIELWDFRFNGWGEKYEANLDNQVNSKISGLLGWDQLKCSSFVLEGGSIESNGLGLLMVSSRCLLHSSRNPGLSREQIEAKLKEALCTQDILWIENGELEGDDTDAHIDTLARFAPDNSLLYVSPPKYSDGHSKGFRLMEIEILEQSQTLGFHPSPLPFPKPIFDSGGKRLPVTYANFLVINQAVLAPVYQLDTDEIALSQLESAFPNRKIIPIDCRTMITQNGAIHCAGMNLFANPLNQRQ